MSAAVGSRSREGEVEGFTGEDGAAETTPGRDFIKTDASITHGNSGGPVVDDQGRLVGIASAFRTRVTAAGGLTETSQVGLVRPLSTASDLLAIAAAGWTPREGHTDVELQPSAVEAPAEGVRISTKVLDASNESPVRDALVMILRPGVNTSAVDVNRLDDQVLAWGRSNTLGEVQLKQPVPVPGHVHGDGRRAWLRAADRGRRAPPRREHAARVRSVGQDLAAVPLTIARGPNTVRVRVLAHH